MTAKLKIGDMVRFTVRCPKYISGRIRKRTRIVTGLYYEPETKCCYYSLGVRGYNELPVFEYYYRSYMLCPVSKRQAHRKGRPGEKRHYNRKNASFKVNEIIRTSLQNDTGTALPTKCDTSITANVNGQ